MSLYPMPQFKRTVVEALGKGDLAIDAPEVRPYLEDPRCWWLAPVHEMNPVRTGVSEWEKPHLQGVEMLRQARDDRGMPTQVCLTYKPYYVHAGAGGWDADFPFESCMGWTTWESFGASYHAWTDAGHDVWQPQHSRNRPFVPPDMVRRIMDAAASKGLPLWYNGWEDVRMMAAVTDLGSTELTEWCAIHMGRLRSELARTLGVDIAAWCISAKEKHHHYVAQSAIHPANEGWEWAQRFAEWALPPTHPPVPGRVVSGLWGTPEADKGRPYASVLSTWLTVVGSHQEVTLKSWPPVWAPGGSRPYIDDDAREAVAFLHVYGGEGAYR